MRSHHVSRSSNLRWAGAQALLLVGMLLGSTATWCAAADGTGLHADYWTNKDLQGAPTLTRVETTVDHAWSDGGPGFGIGNDQFSARWTGWVEAPTTATYTLTTASDDGVRLWWDGQQMINHWDDHGPSEDTATVALTAGQRYAVTIEYYENGGGAVMQWFWSAPGIARQIVPQAQLFPFLPSNTSSTGITAEFWMGIGGHEISSIPVNTQPSSTQALTLFETPSHWADNYGTRVRGFVVPPTTGMYTFWLATDDHGELWLSPSSQVGPATRIAFVSNWTSSREWNRESNQRSASVMLQAGQAYYIAAFQKEGGGGDNLAVGWSKPGESTDAPSEVIPGSALRPFSSLVAPIITTQPAALSVTAGQAATFTVVADGTPAPTYQWQRNGTDIPGAQSASYIIPATVVAESGATFRVQINSLAGNVVSNAVALTVTPVVAPPSGTMANVSPGLIAHYFDDPLFSGKHLRRIDAVVNGEWGDLAPVPGFGPDDFTIWWTGYVVAPVTGTYWMRTLSDDGVVVSVAGQTLMSNWTEHAPTYDSGNVQLEAGQLSSIDIKYFERGWGSVCRLEWRYADRDWELVPASALVHRDETAMTPAGNGTGMRVSYYPGGDLTRSPIDGGVQQPVIDWGTNEPAPGVGQTSWASVWTGSVAFRATGTYLLMIDADDAITVFAGGNTDSNLFGLAGGKTKAVFLAGKAGEQVRLSIVHRQTDGQASLKVRWLGPGIDEPQDLPISQLYPVDRPTQGLGNGNGLHTTFFANTALTGLGHLAPDQMVNSIWNGQAPVPGLDATGWSVEWRGELEAPLTDTYQLHFTSTGSASVELSGRMIIDDVARHGTHTMSSLPQSLIAGQRYPIVVRMANYTATDVVAQLWWSANDVGPALVPRDRLYASVTTQSPLHINAVVASRTNPAWVPFTGATDAATTATAHGAPVQIVREGSARGYLTSTNQAPLGVAISASEPTDIAIRQANGETETARMTWMVTDLAKETGYVPVVIRVHDKLLLTDSTAGNRWECDQDFTGTFTPTFTAQVNGRKEVQYDQPGNHTIISRVDGIETGRVDVTVVAVDFQGPIACELTYRRPKNITAVGGGYLTYTANDDSLLNVETVRAGAQFADLRLMPRRGGKPMVQARIGGVNGPLVGEIEMDEFTLSSSAAQRVQVDETFPDGTLMTSAWMLMSPAVPSLDLQLKIFIGGVTFADSTLEQHISTSAFIPMQDPRFDAGFQYHMLRAPNVHSGLCHGFAMFQNNVAISY